MSSGTANRKRLLIYLMVTWLLLWSLFRLLLYPQQLTTGSVLSSPRGLYVILLTGFLAIAWAFGGPLLLSHWQGISRNLTNIADSPGRVSSTVWIIPATSWFLAYSLFVIAWPLNPAMVDGPALVLALFGFAILIVLVRHKYLRDEQGFLRPAEVRQPSLGRVGKNWDSLPTAVKYLLAFILLGLIVVWWFRRALFDADVIVYGGDIFAQHYNLEAYISALLRKGQIPFWNPYIYSGTPFLAHPQSLVFYPPQFILRLLPLNLSISWAVAFHVWIAGAGMFALARWKRIQFWISFLCAVVFMLNGAILLRIFAGHVWLAYALSWLPLVWLLIIVALDSGRISMIIAAAIGTAMIILTGHPAFPIYILLFLGFYWLWVCFANWRKEKSWRSISVISGRFIAVMALAFGLSAIQMIPTIVYYGQVSLSEGYGAGGANFLAISLADLTALFVPNFYITGHDLGHYWELTPYMGVLFIMLIPFAYTARRADWFRDFLSASALASMALALGSSIGIYFVFYYLLPPFRVARIPPRSLVIFIPTVTLLGGFGLQGVAERAANTRLFSGMIRAYLFFSAFILGIALGVWLDNNGLVKVQLSDSATLPVQLAIGALLIFLVYIKLAGLVPSPGSLAINTLFALALPTVGVVVGILLVPDSRQVAWPLTILSLLVATFTLLLSSVYRRGARPLIVVGFIVLVFLDLFVSGRFYIRAEEPPVFFQNTRLALEDAGLQAFDRVLSYADEPDQYMLGRVGNIDGYNSGVLAGYERFLRGLSGARQTSSPRILLDGSLPDPRAQAFLGTRYIIATEPFENEAFEPIMVGNNPYLYENSEALPRAFVVYNTVYAAPDRGALAVLRDTEFDYASQVVVEEPIQTGPAPDREATVEIINYSEADGSMEIHVETDEPGILVLSEPYYSERSAWLDGSETEMLRVNLGFIGVSVPAGAHDVEIRYEPTSLYVGGAVTGFTILVIVAVSAYAIIHYARRREEAVSVR